MLNLTRQLPTFPSVTLPDPQGGLPVEVSLIAQLGPGGGDALIAQAGARQRGHDAFIDALDEPSTCIGATDFARGDASSLYTFIVGERGHPFHRHRGHRVFTAITGSAGTQLRFAMLPDADWHADPSAFLRALRFVELPPDCLFTVRFGGGTWHQFLPLPGRGAHPALFALSCHTNELGGDLDAAVRVQVLANQADIPSLTETLPEAIESLLVSACFDASRIPTTALALDKPAQQLAGRCCAAIRSVTGRFRAIIGRWRARVGLVSSNGGGREVVAHARMPAASLAHRQLPGASVHEDAFALHLTADEVRGRAPRTLLDHVLTGFLEHRPVGVGQLMRVRNVLVRPFGLRTSPLGCPVSSLLGTESPQWFHGRPVLDAAFDDSDRSAEVVLGADDKHLAFRSVVRVERRADGGATIWLGTRVRTHNLFGIVYITLIDAIHRRYISPAMLRLAVAHAVDAANAQAVERSCPIVV